ncbi:MAG: FHA domain-containing protein [Fimbriimonadales bacterium]
MVDNSVATEEPPVAEEAVVGEEAPAAQAEAQPAKLVVKRSGAETDVEFSVNPPCVIGRFDPTVGPIDIDLGSLPEGSYVSRKHAKITCEDGAWKITDLGSSNGTFLLRQDFEKVDEAELNDGDEIALGNARFVFHLIQPEPAAPIE